MKRLAYIHLVAALLMATTAFAEVDKIKEVVVTMDLGAVTNPAAALRYAKVADDLQGAIAARVVDRTGEEGMKVDIDISEVELSNSFTEIVGSADTRLVGVVHVTDDKNNTNFKTYELTVDVNQAKGFFPETVDLTKLSASSDEYYTAMITAFADAVVRRLD